MKKKNTWNGYEVRDAAINIVAISACYTTPDRGVVTIGLGSDNQQYFWSVAVCAWLLDKPQEIKMNAPLPVAKKPK